MAEQNELAAYAMDFASYLVSKEKNIRKIILHGSIARGDFDEESDVDIFIDADNKLEKSINKKLEDYYKTGSYKEWNLKGISNSISLIIGGLDSDEWKDLKRSITNTGIILYSKYKSEAEKINQYVLFSFENIKPDKKRVSIYRTLFGFKQGGKEYKGMAEQLKAIKIGKGALLIPAENASELRKFFQGKKVTPKIFELWSDVRI